MNLLQAVALGVIQGVTEFVPVSSSAHLVLTPYFLGWSEPSVSFDVALHLGTLSGVVAFFWRDIIRLISAFSASIKEHSLRNDPFRKLSWLIVVGTLPTVILALLFEGSFERLFGKPILVGCLLLVTGVILWLSEHFSSKKGKMRAIKFTDALIIGLAQGCAIAPGISRSGATISAGLFRGLTREASARYSFLLAIPIILGATARKLGGIIFLCQTRTSLIPLSGGFLAAAISGFFAVKYLLKFLQRGRLDVFSYYCFGIGTLTVAFAALKG